MNIERFLALLQVGTVEYSLGGLRAAGVRRQLSIDQCLTCHNV
jgi:hypothetical protein